MGGLVTKEESIEERVERHLTVRELRAEIKSLKEDNNELRRLLAQPKLTRGSGDAVASIVSSEAVDAFVEKLLEDPTTNMAVVPDFMERPLERKMVLYLLGAIAHTLDSAKIQLMGHNIVLRMEPTPPVAPEVNVVPEVLALSIESDALNKSFEASAVNISAKEKEEDVAASRD